MRCCKGSQLCRKCILDCLQNGRLGLGKQRNDDAVHVWDGRVEEQPTQTLHHQHNAGTDDDDDEDEDGPIERIRTHAHNE